MKITHHKNGEIKTLVEEAPYHPGYEDAGFKPKAVNNKPIAWMALNELNGSYSTFTNDQKQRLLPHVSQCYGKWIPLYTHPVKELTLTDEEIMKEWTWKYSDSHEDFLLKFAKAILRKAQEK